MIKKLPQFSAPKNILQPIMIVALILSAYFIGNLSAKVQLLQKGVGTTATGTQAAPADQAQPAAVAVSIDTIKGLFDKDVIKFGDAKKKVLFVEIADPSCPFCHIAAGKNPELNNESPQFKLVDAGGTYIPPVPEMKKMVDEGKAGFVWLYTPGHGNGELGTKAQYCAFEKGKFWEVHDLLMTSKGYDMLNETVKNDTTKSQELATFLAPAIDTAFMKACLESDKYNARLTEETQLASSMGVNGTPGFFVNTTNFSGAYSFKDMQTAVDEALK